MKNLAQTRSGAGLFPGGQIFDTGAGAAADMGFCALGTNFPVLGESGVWLPVGLFADFGCRAGEGVVRLA